MTKNDEKSREIIKNNISLFLAWFGLFSNKDNGFIYN